MRRISQRLAEQACGVAQPREHEVNRSAGGIEGSVCRHLKIAGRIACFTISPDYQQASPQRCNTFQRTTKILPWPAAVATERDSCFQSF